MQCPMLQDIIYEDERCAIFIDGPSIHQICRSLDVDIDYRALRSIFAEAGYLVQARFYATIANDQSYSPLRPLIDWLSYNGFVVVTRSGRAGQDDEAARRGDRGILVELAVDALELSAKLEHVILFSGNGDFLRLIQSLQRRTVRTTIVGPAIGTSSMVSDDLRRQADTYIDLRTLLPFVAKRRQQPAQLHQTA